MQLTIVRQDDELTHVSLSGQLDSQGVSDVSADFHAAVAEVQNPAIVDMSGVEYVMSAGLNMLTQAAAGLKQNGARMVLLAPRELVRKAIHNVALDKLIPIADTYDEAIELLYA